MLSSYLGPTPPTSADQLMQRQWLPSPTLLLFLLSVSNVHVRLYSQAGGAQLEQNHMTAKTRGTVFSPFIIPVATVSFPN
jgi:hypothetical protein